MKMRMHKRIYDALAGGVIAVSATYNDRQGPIT
jgi:hypothetical protein